MAYNLKTVNTAHLQCIFHIPDIQKQILNIWWLTAVRKRASWGESTDVIDIVVVDDNDDNGDNTVAIATTTDVAVVVNATASVATASVWSTRIKNKFRTK